MKDTREKLIRISARLFADKGFAGTSVREIVQKAGANISAIRYHFGDKDGLYQAVLRYLLDDLKSSFFGPNALRVPENIAALPRPQSLELLHALIDCFLDVGFSQRNILLERILLREKLSAARHGTQQLFADYRLRLDQILAQLLSRLTGLKNPSDELVFLSTTVFGQIPLFNFHRFLILRSLGVKDYTPAQRQKIKEQVWRNTQAILNTYEKGKATL